MASNPIIKPGVRVDAWIKRAFPSLTNRHIAEAVEHRLVCLKSGKALEKGERIERNEDLDCTALRNHLATLRQGNPHLDIPLVEETEDEWIVDKPPGIKSQPLSLFDTDTVTHWALARDLGVRACFAEVQPTLTPHRLDVGTSGLLIVAKSRASYGVWRKRFHEHQIKKKYLAWCWGTPRESFYENREAIAHHGKSKSKMVVISAKSYLPPVAEATTFIHVLERREEAGMFLCEVSCLTGVTHQVRVHLAALGFPLVGDSIYDPNYSQRALTPGSHQLRGSELRLGDRVIQADCQSFINFQRDTPTG